MRNDKGGNHFSIIDKLILRSFYRLMLPKFPRNVAPFEYISHHHRAIDRYVQYVRIVTASCWFNEEAKKGIQFSMKIL